METEQLRKTIEKVQAGDTVAYEALLAAYGSRLYGYFYRATGHHHDAEDLLSECTLRLVRTLKNYDDRGRFEPWLFRIAANLVRDRIRRSKTRPRPISLSVEDDNGKSFAAELPGDCPAADANALAAEASWEVRQAMESLDEPTRQMILLRHFGDMSFKEIAKVFECPLGTTLAKVHRGLAKLRKILEANSSNHVGYAVPAGNGEVKL